MTTDQQPDPHPLDREHDPVAWLRATAATLPDGGRLEVRARNAAHIDARMGLLHGEQVGTVAGSHHPLTRRSLFAIAHDAGLVITELRRIEARPGTAPDAIADPALAPLVQDLVLLDPNAATAAFVAVLERPTGANREQAAALDRALSTEEDAAAAQVRALVEAHQREQAELLQSRQELIAVQNGKLMRWSQFPRRVYRRLRRLLRMG